MADGTLYHSFIIILNIVAKYQILLFTKQQLMWNAHHFGLKLKLIAKYNKIKNLLLNVNILYYSIA